MRNDNTRIVRGYESETVTSWRLGLVNLSQIQQYCRCCTIRIRLIRVRQVGQIPNKKSVGDGQTGRCCNAVNVGIIVYYKDNTEFLFSHLINCKQLVLLSEKVVMLAPCYYGCSNISDISTTRCYSDRSRK